MPEHDADATADEIVEPPMGDGAAAAVEDFIPAPGELVLHDPHDPHELSIVMDAHDVRMLLERVQSSALRKWVYDADGKMGLSVSGVQDLTQLMSWTGKAKLHVMAETLDVQRIEEDMGSGPEHLWVATVFARDEITGAQYPGTSMEPVYMRLTEKTAAEWRRRGKDVPEDRRVFDVFSRTKAINKAYRNALAAFIPEELEQTIIAMFANDPSRVEKIQTEAEAKVAEMPPPDTSPEALAIVARCQALYDEIRELAGGQGRIKFPPGQFSAWMLRSQHDVESLQRFESYLVERREQIPVEVERERQEREAVDTVLDAVCPKCGAKKSWRCKTGKKNDKEQDILQNKPHPERLRARLAEIQGTTA